MVHRRLLTVMLLLLVGLVIASAVTPPPAERRGDAGSTDTTTTPTATSEAGADGPSRAEVPAGASGVLPRDRTVSARPGQTVDLQVTASEPATIEIPALAALQPAAPGSPAQFIVAFGEAGRYEVRNMDTGDAVGAVVVE